MKPYDIGQCVECGQFYCADCSDSIQQAWKFCSEDCRYAYESEAKN